VGVACGAVAVVNILSRNLSRTQEDVILVIGAVFWVLGGVVCYACDAIRIEGSSQQPENKDPGPAERPLEQRRTSGGNGLALINSVVRKGSPLLPRLRNRDEDRYGRDQQ
jgi:hypothetical protein